MASRGFGTPALATLGVGLVALPVLVTVLVWAAAAACRCTGGSRPRAAGRATRSMCAWCSRGGPRAVGLDRLLDIARRPGPAAPRTVAGAARRDGVWVWRLARAARGDHQLPPPVAHVGDPFGLARRSRAGAGGQSLLVVPRAPRLERLGLEATTPGGGLRRRRMVAGFGELERVRDYRAGDPLSRVHWAQTAKRGRLQTKELRASEGPGKAVMLLLDASPGEGAGRTSRPPSPPPPPSRVIWPSAASVWPWSTPATGPCA